MPVKNISTIPFGAVYFRKSNPPKEDWVRDYKTAKEDGMNFFRHWVLWSAVEVSPGVFDWSDYDRQLDLAADNSIQTILAEMVTSAPEWAFIEFAHAKIETKYGEKLESQISPSCVTGGFPGLCLDNEDVRLSAEQFLTSLAARYQHHPALVGYDVWNECGIDSRACYCPATAEKFREWLQGKYQNLNMLSNVWKRFGYTDWSQVNPPKENGPYPHVLDWLQFRIDNAYRLLHWRVEIIRGIDPRHVITAHGVAGSLRKMPAEATDDWRAATEVDSYGITWGSSRHGDEPWKQFHAVDLVRASSRGKTFWHAEAYGGPLWMQPQVIGKSRDQGRIASPEDIRYWHLVSFMGGARGSFYLRWRPLLDGPLFGAFGPYGINGARTERSEMASKVAGWVTNPENEIFWRSSPIKGDVGILFVPETELFSYAQQGDTQFYADSLEGAYQGFFDANIQADWVHVEDMENYDFLYLPYPVMLNKDSAQKIKRWVDNGGILVSEGCIAYWGDNARVGVQQPNMGFDQLFGVKEEYVEFTPDLLTDLRLTVDGSQVWGGIFMQTFQPILGKPVGWYEDGRIAACDHTYGKGRTRLIGSMCGSGYAHHPENRSPAFFNNLMQFAGKQPHVTSSNPRIKARLQEGPAGLSIWVANPTRQSLPVHLRISPNWGPFSHGEILWGDNVKNLFITGRTVALLAPARDVVIILLKHESDSENYD